MPVKDPYAEFQKPLQAVDPYAEFQQPLVAPAPPPAAPVTTSAPSAPGTFDYHPPGTEPGAPLGSFADRVLRPVGNMGRTAVSDITSIPAQISASAKAPTPTFADALKVAATGAVAGPAYRPLKAFVQGTKQSYDLGNRSGGVREGIEKALDDAEGHLLSGYLTGKAAGMAGSIAKGSGQILRLAAATPAAQEVAATRALVPGAPSELLTRALKPPVTMPDFEQSVEASLPKIAPQNPTGVKGFASAAKSSMNAEQDWYKSLTDPLRPFKVDASPIADAQMESIPLIDRIERPAVQSPSSYKRLTVPSGDGGTMQMGTPTGGGLKGGIYNSTAEKANNYRQIMPLGAVDDIRKGANPKLQAFFNKSGGDRYAALSDPETARMAAIDQASRDLAYNNFSRLSAAGRTDGGIPASEIASNQNLYGQLKDVSEVSGKRATVTGRANPMSLQETLALKPSPMGVVDYAGQRLFKGLTNSDALANAAIDRFNSPNRLNLPARPSLYGKSASALGNVFTNSGDALKNSSTIASPLFFNSKAKKKGLYD